MVAARVRLVRTNTMYEPASVVSLIPYYTMASERGKKGGAVGEHVATQGGASATTTEQREQEHVRGGVSALHSDSVMPHFV